MGERHFINPFTDFGFKRIFGQEVSKELLKDFLNLLLKGERTIVDLQFMNPEMLPETEDNRKVVFDLYCKSEDGTYFVVEMQASRQANFKDRSLYYQSRIISAQGRIGNDWNYNICPVYGVFFMNFIMSAKLRTDVALMDMENGKVFNPKLRQIFLEMPLFLKEAEECENDFERWLYLIKNMNILTRMPFQARRKVWDKLLGLADRAAMTQEEDDAYEASLKVYRDYNNTIDYARMEGREIGLAEGREEGIAEGKKEGREEGERNKQLEIAGKLKAGGLSIASIVEFTGLTEEEINQL